MFTRIAAPALGPNLSAAIRITLAALTLMVIMRAMRQPWPVAHWRECLLLGLLGVAGPHLLYSRSALYLPGGYSALLTVTSVMFGAFASAWMKVERLTPLKIIGCLLGFAGAALLVHLGPVEPTPAVLTAAGLCICGAALSGSSTPLLKRATLTMEPLAITAGMHAGAALLLLPGALSDIPHAHFTAVALGAVALMGVGTSGIAYWMYMRIVKFVPPTAALSSTFMITAFGVLWGALFLGEPVGLAMLAGGGLILLACLLVFGLHPLKDKALDLSDKP
jgi:drug/metabolite transporter (DMT)-like permease